MLISLLSAKPITDETLRILLSKKLDLINGMQMAAGKSQQDIITFPIDYPMSVMSLSRSISISDAVLFIVNDEISSLDAELALAVEHSRISIGKIIFTEASDMGSFQKFFGMHKLGGFEVVKLGDSLTFNNKEPATLFSYVSIDKHFIVKGIGNVIIGFNLGVPIKKGDKLFLLPSSKEITVKSIQIMDVDSTTAGYGTHVGLALNNTDETDLENNYALSSVKELSDSFDCEISVSSFYKSDPFASKGLSAAVLGKNFLVALSNSGNKARVKFNKPTIKFAEKHVLFDSSLPAGKNRVVGSMQLL